MAALLYKQEMFDFSLDALEFRKRLQHQLMETVSASSIEPVDDHDLEWVNAAGTPHLAPDDDNRCASRSSKRLE